VQLAASHILSLSSLFEQASHVEFGIIEMMLTLVLQPAERDPIYLCAVLLELCKLAPSLIPPVIAAGMKNTAPYLYRILITLGRMWNLIPVDTRP
jgi:hypothetical protein